MNDRQLLTLLEAIKSMALLPHPFPDGVRVNTALVGALGSIAGIAIKALEDYPVPQ